MVVNVVDSAVGFSITGIAEVSHDFLLHQRWHSCEGTECHWDKSNCEGFEIKIGLKFTSR